MFKSKLTVSDHLVELRTQNVVQRLLMHHPLATPTTSRQRGVISHGADVKTS